MIVRMSKIEIIGPRDLLMQVLSLIQQRGVLQIDGEIRKAVHKEAEPHLKSMILDGQTLSERLFFEDLKFKIDRLLTYLPQVAARESYIKPPTAINTVANLVKKHIESCVANTERRAGLQKELTELNRYIVFLTTVESLLPKGTQDTELEFIGIEVRDPATLEHLSRLAGKLLLGAEVKTLKAEDGTYIGLLTTERELSDKLKESLRDNQIPEVTLPSYLEELPFPEKMKAARKRFADLTAEAASIDRELSAFAERWLDIYRKFKDWLEDRLSLLQTSASLYETETCFFLFGWIPSADLDKLDKALTEQFKGQLVVEEKEILEQDLDRVPVALKNPTYFQPFELFSKLLPRPRYTSYDPTPFLGVFFPIFFGMILGDIGYGVILLLVSMVLIKIFKKKRYVCDVGKIMLICSIYTMFFGWLFGECFGEQGGMILGLEPICFDRRVSIMTTLYFSVAVGVVHVSLGLFFGFLSALKKKMKKEAVVKLLSVFLVLSIVFWAASFFVPVLDLVRRPLLAVLLSVAAVVVVLGGLLAPLEVFKALGNIISYARIMAVGLTSVLLAYIANDLAGNAGSLIVGVFVGVLLHTLNIVLGVFAPTIQSLRLHYVEFFSKFLEPGGREFEPLGKTK
jgi:V/A-type H+-transporting ATPase subunit I